MGAAPGAAKQTALAALALGLCPIPPRQDGSKSPDVTTWKPFQKAPPTVEQIEKWYSWGGRTGVGTLCGKVSGNLEMLEWETLEVFQAYQRLVEEAGLTELFERACAGYLEEAPSGGFHVLYRCSEIEGNQKLAQYPNPDNPEEPKALIETRGEGGYVIIAPSNGKVHPTGRPYVLRRGSLETIEEITPEERGELFRLARVLDEMPAPIQRNLSTVSPDTVPDRAVGQDSNRPGDDFNARALWAEVLQGWTEVYTDAGITYWRRPGKDRGVSATTNHGGLDLLRVFSTSTRIPSLTWMKKFEAYAHLNHGGDFKAAARELGRQGYGDQSPPTRPFFGYRPNEGDPDGGTAPNGYRCTDLGNGERFAYQAHDRLRYEHASRLWYGWDGNRWRRDAGLQAEVLAHEVARGIYDEAAQAEDEHRRVELAKHAVRTESRQRQNAMIESARHMVSVDPDLWDQDPLAFNVANGTIDLQTGGLRQPSVDDYLTKISPVLYDPAAECPTFDRFLADVLPDQEVRDFLQRSVGYASTGLTIEQYFWFLIGLGANGKSTLMDLLLYLLGDYGQTAAPHLLERGPDRHPTEVARLDGCRLAVAHETAEGRRLDEEKVKALTGGDPLVGRFMRGDFFDFDPTHKIWLHGNHKPQIVGTDHAIWRRPLLIDFPVTIPDSKKDPNLLDKLKAESSGVLNWMLTGCLWWRQDGLQPPRSVLTATEAYRMEEDRLGAFLADRTVSEPGASEAGGGLYRAYTGWCKEQGEEKEMMNATQFGRSLTERGYPVVKTGHANRRMRQGIRIADSADSADPSAI